MSDHRRGTGCDCTDCYRRRKAATVAYARRAGRSAYATADRARAHIDALVMGGMSCREIADRAGVHLDTAVAIRTGRRRRVLLATEAAILAIQPYGTAIGLQRRLQALACLGWSQRDLGDRMGVTLQAVQQQQRGPIRRRYPHVRAAIIAVYADLEGLRSTARLADRVARQAIARGWCPPAAWDDIDDPDETPTDWQRPAVVYRRSDMHAAAVDDLMEVGYSRDTAVAEVAYRHGVQVASVLVALDRHERRAA